ncbi:MAG: hypothetical protein QME60_09275 [Verrucomicrobiota bacterium]|nr:hypothetical protein [Verrucomicrobiota bacterium]
MGELLTMKETIISRMLLIAAIAVALSAIQSLADSTINATNRHAYGANVGWLDWRADATNGAVLGQSCCTGYVWSANCGWICLGNGPTNGWQYGNTAVSDWGVNYDGAGNLSGCAYGANVGWLVFEQTNGQPRLDLATGKMIGYVWSANVGWIGLSNAYAHVQTDTLSPGPDTDGDNIPDPWEYARAGNLTALSNGTHHADGDGATDIAEYGADTDPLNETDNLHIVSLTVAGSTNTVVWTCRPTRFYRLEMTNTLVGTGAWTDCGPGLLRPPPASPMTREVPGVTDTTRFYRVKAIVPLTE